MRGWKKMTRPTWLPCSCIRKEAGIWGRWVWLQGAGLMSGKGWGLLHQIISLPDPSVVLIAEGLKSAPWMLHCLGDPSLDIPFGAFCSSYPDLLPVCCLDSSDAFCSHNVLCLCPSSWKSCLQPVLSSSCFFLFFLDQISPCKKGPSWSP